MHYHSVIALPNFHSYTEKELLLLASQGNETAFTQLYNLYKDKMYGFSLKITESPELAKDLTQDVFLKLWKDRNNLSAVDNFGGYIFKIAKNQALNAFKRMANESLILSKLQKEIEVKVSSTEENLAYKDVQKTINEIVKTLPPQQKLIFTLSREQGLKHDEIAKQLNLSPSTVKNHLVLALQTIREYLNKKNLHLAGLWAIIVFYFDKK